jgi:hypothetical protein
MDRWTGVRGCGTSSSRITAVTAMAVAGLGGKSESGRNDQSEEKNFVGFHKVGPPVIGHGHSLNHSINRLLRLSLTHFPTRVKAKASASLASSQRFNISTGFVPLTNNR